MDLDDVNVLVYAHREDSPNHLDYRNWLENLIQNDQAYGAADIILSGFVRIVTHPRIFSSPTDLPTALQFVHQIRNQSNCVHLDPGPRHWSIFVDLCQTAGVKGNLVPDAYLAALAIESGSQWITVDRGYNRFPGLTWRHPLDG